MNALVCLGALGVGITLAAWFSGPLEPPPRSPRMQIVAPDGAAAYQANFESYRYEIETIGVVSIDAVELDGARLRATYSYVEGGRTRHVVSDLTRDRDGIYKGTCTTRVGGEVLFRVATWLEFAEDGTASGHWSWSGRPRASDPRVDITRR